MPKSPQLRRPGRRTGAECAQAYTGRQSTEAVLTWSKAPGKPRKGCRALAEKLAELSGEELARCPSLAEAAMMDLGITFNVYGHEHTTGKSMALPRHRDGR